MSPLSRILPSVQTITVRCGLAVPEDEAPNLVDTFRAYAEACSFLNAKAAETDTSNAIRLHHTAYRDARKRFGLSANLVVTAIRRVCGNIKANGQKPRVYKPTSISLDARIFRFNEKDWTVGVTTLDGRKRFVLRVGEYQRNLLKGHVPKFATLVKTRRGFAINVCIEIEPEAVQNLRKDRVLGIDCGIKRLAVASTGKIWSSEKLLAARDRFARVRASLQSKGTKGAKRALKRLSGRESRYVRWMNHNVSKEIVALARRKLCGIIAVEDLTHIRRRAKRWNKHANRMIHSWPFGELQRFVEYKAALRGIDTVHVAPAGTSKTCHRCGQEGKRDKAKFVCTNERTCGKLFDADINAAKNIAVRGGACKPPRESTIGDVLFEHFSHQSKAPAFTQG